VFVAYMLRIDILSWWIVPFINMKWPSLSLFIDFSLKSPFSDMRIDTSSCFWSQFACNTFFHLLTLRQLFSYESLVCIIWFDVVFKSNLLFYVSWLEYWGHLHSVLVSRSTCCFQFSLFPCCLVLPLPCLLVCLLKGLYSLLSLPVSL
jgi:hypothetical protein